MCVISATCSIVSSLGYFEAYSLKNDSGHSYCIDNFFLPDAGKGDRMLDDPDYRFPVLGGQLDSGRGAYEHSFTPYFSSTTPFEVLCVIAIWGVQTPAQTRSKDDLSDKPSIQTTANGPGTTARP
jgi:hypothetical protein